MILTNRVLLTTQIPSNALVSCIRMRGATVAMVTAMAMAMAMAKAMAIAVVIVVVLMDRVHGSSNDSSPTVS